MIDHRLTDAEVLQLEADLREEERRRHRREQDQSPLITKGIIAGICLSAPIWVLLYYGCRALLKAMGVV